MVIIIITASLAGGTYFGYRSGYESSRIQLEPELQRQINLNANITSENEALRNALPSIMGKTVKIGCIAPDTVSYTPTKVFMEKVIQPDINAYVSGIGYNVRFEFVVGNAEGRGPTHLELVKNLHENGTDIFIGGFWTSQGDGSLNYVNANRMLMVSPTSTRSTFALANDRFYRMSPSDSALPLSMADIIWSYGVKELVVLQRGDSWADEFLDIFSARWKANGGVTAGEAVRYPAESVEFSSYLQQAEAQCEGALARVGNDSSKIGVLLLTFTETPQILKQASQYGSLYNLAWFWGAPELVLFDPMSHALQAVVDEAPLEAEHVKLFTPISRKPESVKFDELSARYTAATGEIFGIEEAYLYDAAWVLAKGVLETGSDNATKVTEVLPSICENFYGASGWCRLNGFGDRSPPPFEVLIFASGSDSTIGVFLAGIYNPDSRLVNWNTPDNPLGKMRFGISGSKLEAL